MAEFKITHKIMRLPDVIPGMQVIMAQDRIINLQKQQFRLARIMQKYHITPEIIQMAQGITDEAELPKEYTEAMLAIEADDLAMLSSFQTTLVKESIGYYQELGAEFEPEIDKWTYNELSALVNTHNPAIQERIMGKNVLPDLKETAKKAQSQ